MKKEVIKEWRKIEIFEERFVIEWKNGSFVWFINNFKGDFFNIVGLERRCIKFICIEDMESRFLLIDEEIWRKIDIFEIFEDWKK